MAALLAPRRVAGASPGPASAAAQAAADDAAEETALLMEESAVGTVGPGAFDGERSR
jgi:hypothetical protein